MVFKYYFDSVAKLIHLWSSFTEFQNSLRVLTKAEKHYSIEIVNLSN